MLPNYADLLIESFSPKPNDENAPNIDTTKPYILLSTYVGAKGLSGGHVFILGMHEGGLPNDNHNITDIEISQFIVALTRSRKKFI